MRSVKSAWQKIVQLGCSPDVNGLQRTQIMMVNVLSAVMIIVVSCFLVFYLINGINKWPNWLPAYPLLLAVLFLNRNGNTKAARLIFFWGGLVLIFAWGMLNRRNGAEYGLVVLGVSSAMLFRRNLSIYIGALSALFVITAYKVYDHTTPFVPNDTYDYTVVPNLILVVAVGIVFFEVLIYKGLANFYFKKISKKYSVLEDVIEAKKRVEEELNIANEELRASNEALNNLTDQLDKIVKQKSLELQSYLNAINIHIYSAITDTNGIIMKVNDPLIKVTGYSREELVGNNFSVLNSGFHNHDFYNSLYRKITNGETWRGETRNKAKNGSLFWIDQVILPIKNENGELSCFLMLALPITERKKIDEERARTMQIFDLITHKASHEIRGPLARMMGLSILLEKNLVRADEITFVALSLRESSNELDLAIHDLTAFIGNNNKLF